MAHETRSTLDRRRFAQSAGFLLAAGLAPPAAAQAPGPAPADDIPARVQALIPDIEAYLRAGMKAFDVPGAVIGIATSDRVLYTNGFGVRARSATDSVTPETVFQIGSTTKAFLATILAIAVERGALKWDDRVVDLDPAFAMFDPYVTREFRVFDLLAQRSGLPPYANDLLAGFGYDVPQLLRSLRFTRPVFSFRSTFAYTNITHMFGGRIAARALDAPDWPTLAVCEIARPLGLGSITFSAEALMAAPDHAVGHRWTPEGSIEIPFDPTFPYLLGPAGDINANLRDCLTWLRLHLGDGTLEGRRLVSAENLSVTRIPRVGISDVTAYATGWAITSLPNGRAVWHNGGTGGFGAHIGFLPASGVGVVILSNQQNQGFPDAVAMGIYGRLLRDPPSDPIVGALDHARRQAAETANQYLRPPSPTPPPDSAALIGNYHNNILGQAALSDQNGALTLTLAETGARIRLDPFDGAAFVASLVPEGRFAVVVAGQGDPRFGFASFQANDTGRLTRLRLSSEGQSYLFARS